MMLRTGKAVMFAAAMALLFAQAPVFASSKMIQPNRLVSGHTAGVLPRAHFDAEINVYPAYPTKGYGSGLITAMHVGITDRFTLGLSYGGDGIIGYSKYVDWNPYPGVVVKYRIFEEKYVSPAVTIGFDNQGYGGRVGKGDFGYDGYLFKSPGLFAAISKSFILADVVQIGFHGTVNYSLEEADDVTWPNVMGGMDIGINEELSLVAEYDFALNDISGNEYKKRHYANPLYGYFGIGLRWAFTENFHLEFDVKDIFENKVIRRPAPQDPNNRVPIGWSRELKVIYITKF